MLHNGSTVDEAIAEFIRYFDSIVPDYWNRRTKYTTFKDLGQTMIREYAATYKWTEHVTLATEFRFMIPFGEHELSGIVDHMYTNHNMDRLYLSDFKTGAKPNLDTLHLDIQMTSYWYASYQKEFWCGYPGEEEKYTGLENGEELYEIFRDVPRTVYWYDLRKNQAVDVGPRGDFDVARMYRLVEQIARAVEFEVFVPNISAESCYFCDHKDICPVYTPPPVPVAIDI